jgi:hypothetical protein
MNDKLFLFVIGAYLFLILLLIKSTEDLSRYAFFIFMYLLTSICFFIVFFYSKRKK